MGCILHVYLSKGIDVCFRTDKDGCAMKNYYIVNDLSDMVSIIKNKYVSPGLKCFLRYGSDFEDDSKDEDLIEVSFDILNASGLNINSRNYFIDYMNDDGSVGKENTKYYTYDVIFKEKARKSQFLGSFAYYNLKEDYGEEIANKWLEWIEPEYEKVMELEEWSRKNVQNWQNLFNEKLHPITWAKMRFAQIQYKGIVELGKFLNSKNKLIKYFPNEISDALDHIWSGSEPLSEEVLNEIGVEAYYEKADGEWFVNLYKDDKVVEYPIEVYIQVWSYYEDTLKEIESQIQEYVEAKEVPIKENVLEHELNHEVDIWDGYGL